MTTPEVTFDSVLALARRLRPVDQVRLVARLVPTMEHWLVAHEPPLATSRPALRGLLADLGTAPSETEITTAQRELWARLGGDAT